MAVVSFLTHFFYPNFCLHCNQQIFKKKRHLCEECLEQIDWIDSTLSCQICGKPKRDRMSFRCFSCRNRPCYLTPIATCFLPEGPAWTLHEQLRVYEYESIAKTFASLLTLKWKKLSWPFPDAIVPVPDSRLETILHKRQANYLIARALSRLFSAPFRPVLTTRERGTSHMYCPKTFFRGSLVDKKILLVTDVLRESGSLRSARDALFSLFPKTVYTLALFDRRD